MLPLSSFFGDDAPVLRETNFQLLLLANVLPPLGTSLLSPVLDSLIEPFGVSPANVGLMISVYTAPPIVMVPVAGVLADRYGRKPLLVPSLLLFGLAGTAIAFTSDFRVALFLRLLQGIAFGGITPIIITSIGDFYAGSKEATAQGLRFTGSGLTATVFPLLAGLLVVIAWQYPFLLYAIALPIAALVYLWFDEPTASKPAARTESHDRRSYLRALFELVRRRRVLAFVLARSLPSIGWLGFLTYNSIIVVRLLGGTPAQAGALAAIGSLVYAIAASQAGRISSMFHSRFYPLVGANLCLAVGLAVVVVAPVIGVAGVGIAIFGVGFGLSLSLYRTIITGLAPQSLRSGLVSLSEAGAKVTGTLTPIAMGGAIAVATPILGFGPAVQASGLGAALVGGVGGILCLLVARTSPHVPVEWDQPSDE